MSQSPFTQNKFEYEDEHLYYLPDELFSAIALDAPKPVYLIGTRGTGKTTLMKALSWNERTYNRWLRDLLPTNQFRGSSGNFLGIYVNVPLIQMDVLRSRLVDVPDNIAGTVYCRYFDLCWLEELAFAIADLLSNGELEMAPSVERKHVRGLMGLLDTFFEPTPRKPQPRTAKAVNDYLRQRRYDMDSAAHDTADIELLLGPRGPSQSYGELGRELGLAFADFCSSAEGLDGKWYFKACFDQTESLNDLQRVAFHTLVRLSEWPVFPVLSFVSTPPDIERTLLQRIPAQAADREVIDLDQYLQAAKFRDYAEGVVNVRLDRLEPGGHPRFDVQDVLGPLDINALLEQKIKVSETEWARKLLERAERYRVHPFFKDRHGTSEVSPPIYQAFIIEELGIELPGPSEPNWARRGQDSSELRKRMVAAYLCICEALGTGITYASSDMVLGLADRCIRDFLRFMDYIFKESGAGIGEFLKAQVPRSVQHKGIQAASQRKAKGIRGSEVSAPQEAESIVRGLGLVTANLQRKGERTQALRSSERGIFVVPFDSVVRDHPPDSLQTVRESIEAAYLTSVHREGSTEGFAFRVHSSLAPTFGFSYRGAYYPVRLSWAQLEALRKARDRDAIRRIAEEIGSGDDLNLSLFGVPND